ALEVAELRDRLAGRERLEARLIGVSPAMERLRRLIADLADTSANVLIHGETGTGKELVARAIHDEGPRRDQTFVAVNCAAIPDGLIESELFGYEEGAFT
ncbi:sigma-54 factor interaction domain-containing protein, partial [Salmonella enterica subsp. enterica serovar Typhimurium]|nr:sigma-54 factor interaction domain-containing protein [Salmonella enterica subsp. enterica serovar Typhimurium]